MKNKIKKLFCTVLAFCMLAGTLSLYSCKVPDKTPAVTLSDSYTIVTGDEMDTINSQAAKTLSETLSAEGITAEVKTDADGKSDEFVILVGQTSRDESKKSYEKLDKIDDFIVDPISEKVIVICGKTPLATEAAVEYFLTEYVRAGTNEFEKTLFISGSTVYKKEYPYSSVTLEGVEIKDFVIAINDDTQVRNAYQLAHYLGSQSGEIPSIVKYGEIDDQNRGVVCLGSNGRDTSTPLPEGLDGFFLNLTEGADGVTIAVDWTDEKYIEKAITAFGERFAVSGDESMGVGKGRFTSVTKHGFTGLNAVNSAVWRVESTTENQVTEGVTQVTYKCKGYRDLPYLVHVMIADLDYVDLMLGTANNSSSVVDEWIQTPADHAWAAIDAGHNVVAAMNAGYPEGISIKDGNLLVKGTIHRPYFAVTKSGEPVILYDDNAADVKNLQLAACGTHVIVDNYMPGELAMDEEFSYTTHPRTLIGIRGDGKVVMVVIDGRQPELSNGSPMVRSADIMMQLGCKYALNLDGGGSSCMIVRQNGGPFKTVNKISDPVMRKVRNSILIVEKEG